MFSCTEHNTWHMEIEDNATEKHPAGPQQSPEGLPTSQGLIYTDTASAKPAGRSGKVAQLSSWVPLVEVTVNNLFGK